MKVPDWLERAFRATEIVHTLVWMLAPIVASISAGFVGHVSGMARGWNVALPLLVFAISSIVAWIIWRRGYYPMPFAAQTAYDQLKGVGVGSFSKGFDKSGKFVLNEVATLLWEEIQLYGKEPPSTTIEMVPNHLNGRGNLTDNGSCFHLYGEDSPEFVDIGIKRSDLWPTIRKLRRELSQR